MSSDAASLIVGVGGDISDFGSKMDAAGHKLGDFEKQAQSTGDHAGGFLSQAFSFATGGLIQKGIETLSGALGGFFAGTMSDASEAASSVSQLGAVIASTGGKAGVTADMAENLANSFEATTRFAAETTQAGESMLLTFTNIGSNVFPEATQTLLDMSQAMGTDTKNQAIQLGKALNDPINGISALSKVGVTFSDSQKAMIKSMVAAGDTAGAQCVILKELHTEFGGSAAAAGQTFAGQMDRLKNSFGNVTQAVGDALLPRLSSLLGVLTDPGLISSVAAFASGLTDGLGAALDFVGGAIGRVWPTISAFGALLIDAFSSKSAKLDLLQKLPGWLQPLGKLIADLVGNWGEFFGALQSGVSPLQAVGDLIKNNFVDTLGNLGPLLSGVGQVLSSAFTGALDFLVKNALPALGSALANLGSGIAGAIDSILAPQVTSGMNKVGGGFFDWVGTEVLPRVGEVFGTVAGAIGGWITGGGLAALVGNLARWGQALVDWVGPMIPPLLQTLGDLAGQAGAWLLNTGLPALVQQLSAWGQAFVAWVGPQIPPLLNTLGDLLGQAAGWVINTGLPTLVGKLAEWGGAFLAWVGPQIGPLLGKLGELLTRVGVWIITDAGPKIRTQLLDWGKAFLDWVGPQIPPLLGKLGDLLTQVGVWLLTVARPAIWEKLGEWGHAFLDWVTQDVLPFIGAKLGEVGAAIVGWIGSTASDLLGKAGQMGSNIIQGMLGALGAGKQQVINFIENIASGALDAIKNFFGIHSPSTKMHEIFTNLLAGGTNALQDGQGPLTTAIGATVIGPTMTALQGMVTSVGPALAGLPAAFTDALKPVSDLLQAQATTPTDATSLAYWWSGNPRALLQMMGRKIDQGSDSLKAYAGPAMKGVTDYVSNVIHNEMPSIVQSWAGYLTQMVNATQAAANAMKSALGSIPTAPSGGGGGPLPPTGGGGTVPPGAGGSGGGGPNKSNALIKPLPTTSALNVALTKQAVQIIAYLQLPNGQLQQVQATIADIRQVSVASGGAA